LKLNLKKPLVFFDLEATGLNISTDKIIEFCFIKLMPDGDRKTLTNKVNPGIPIPHLITELTGVSEEDVKNAPKFNEVAKNIAQFLEGCDLAGFNILKFDLPMLTEEFLRANVDFKTENRCMIDAQKIFHLMEPRNLAAAFQFYCNQPLQNAHSAEADTQATLEILLAQVERYEGKIVTDDKGNQTTPVQNDISSLHKLSISNYIDFAGRFVYNTKGEEIVNFGKHKDKTVAWVLKNEPGYYDWFIKADFTLDSKRKFTEIKLKQMSI
jgi:DNA polymerase III subunit epsilon